MTQEVNDLACFYGTASLIPGGAQWVKDPALPQLWCTSKIQLRINAWPRHFHMLWIWPIKGGKKENQQITYQEIPFCYQLTFQHTLCTQEGNGKIIPKKNEVNEKKLQPRILYPERLSFRWE